MTPQEIAKSVVLFQVYVTYPPLKRERKSTVHIFAIAAENESSAEQQIREHVTEPAHEQTYGKASSFECFPVESGFYFARSFKR